MTVRPGQAVDRRMRTDSAWELSASQEPYFAVLTDPRFLRTQLTPEAEHEVFAIGEQLVA